MLRTLVKLLLLAALVVAAVEYGPAALRRLRDARAGPSSPEVDDETGPIECLAAAEHGSEVVGEVAYRFNPGNLEAWRAAEADAQQALADARAACFCASTACRRVEQALDELDGVLEAYRDMMDARGGGFVNPASSHERAFQLLAEARALLE
ncbi:MAG: hypothetical protein ACRD0X_04575 [Thermoanaerobaculia bacterium]